LQPIPLIGLSPFVGLIVAFSGILIVFHKRFFIPRRWKERQVPSRRIINLCQQVERLFDWSNRWIHPRGQFMSRQNLIRRLNGSIIFICGILLALPLPFPASNTLPAMAIMAISLGSLKEDGLLIILGWCLSCIATVYIVFLCALPVLLTEHAVLNK
jgi:hypothetical protein